MPCVARGASDGTSCRDESLTLSTATCPSPSYGLLRLRHNRAVLGSWDELIDNVGPRAGMFVGQAKYALVRSFVEGFGAARDDGVLRGFQHWLSSQPQHRAIENYAWSSLLLHEVFPERDQLIMPAWQQDPATADPRWPLPPPSPASEDDLAYPEDDRQAIAHLFARLREYLDSRPASGEGQQTPATSIPARPVTGT